MGNFFVGTPVDADMAMDLKAFQNLERFSSTVYPASANVYLVRTKQPTPGETCSDALVGLWRSFTTNSLLVELRYHWIVVVDPENFSDEDTIRGLEIHIIRNRQDQRKLLLY